MELKDWLSLLTPLALSVIALLWKGAQVQMHSENQKLLTAIDKKIDKVDAKLDTHVALDGVTHKEFERRLDCLEDQ